MTGPRTKRQFAGAASDPSQRSITSFFAKSSAASAETASRSPSQAVLNGPALPAQVQTDLLTVGMRVRKAIPEGYKTGSTYSAFTLWAEDNTSIPTNGSGVASTATSATYASTMRELEPFCGLNKVGGLAFQPAYGNTLAAADDDDMGAMPGLTSSQDTIASVASTISSGPTPILNMAPAAATAASNRKRSFTSDEDEAAHDALSTSLTYRGPMRRSCDSQDGWLDEEISPRSLAPPAGLWENARVLAVPRRSRQGRKSEAAGELGAVGQENVMVVVRGEDGNDFEEASFLDYGIVGDARMEIE